MLTRGGWWGGLAAVHSGVRERRLRLFGPTDGILSMQVQPRKWGREITRVWAVYTVCHARCLLPTIGAAKDGTGMEPFMAPID